MNYKTCSRKMYFLSICISMLQMDVALHAGAWIETSSPSFLPQAGVGRKHLAAFVKNEDFTLLLLCRSHYVICRGKVKWAGRWTPREIFSAGRRKEEKSRQAYHENLDRQYGGILKKLWLWVTSYLSGRKYN